MFDKSTLVFPLIEVLETTCPTAFVIVTVLSDIYESQVDAAKMDNLSGKTNIAVVSSDNKDLHWNYMDENISSTIPIRVYRKSNSGIVENYTLELNNIDELLAHNKCLTFEDTELGISFPLTGDTTYSFTMNDTVTVSRLFITVNSPSYN